MSFLNPKFLEISSRDNPKLKFVRLVRDGREHEFMFIEGLRLCEEILKTENKINSVFFTDKFSSTPRGIQLLENLQQNKNNLYQVSDKLFDTLSDTKQSQGIIIIAEKPITGKSIIEDAIKTAENPLLLLLHQINNPANLGAILRTAEATGVTGIITTENTTDVFSAKALRGSMGANFRLPFWINADYFEVLKWAQSLGINSICADVKSLESYLDINWQTPKLLVLGSEGHGLTDEETSATDESLIIPMDNDVESLNVAVACGVILFEAKRQRS